jgi:hypothetical protein
MCRVTTEGGTSPLRGSLEVFPLDLVLAMLAEATATGRLELADAEGRTTSIVELTAGTVTGAAHGALRGASAIVPVAALQSGSFAFVPGPTGKPNLLAGEDLRARTRAARDLRREPERAPAPEVPKPAGPNTLRLRSVAGLLGPLVPDAKTTAVKVGADDVDLGPEQERLAPTPDPLWSATHLAGLVNALLYGYLGTDQDLRARELESLFAAAGASVSGSESAPPIQRGGIDIAAVERATGAAWLVPVLQDIVRRLFESDDAVQEGNHAKRVLLAAVERTLGPGPALTRDALRVVGAGPRLRGRISIERGSTEGPFEIDEREHRIGRSSANDVRIDHGSVSRRHARVVPRSGRFVLSDVGSSGGTRVDGSLLSGEHVLRGGESIGLGDVVLHFEYLDA